MTDAASLQLMNAQMANLPNMLINNMAATYITKLMDKTNMSAFTVQSLVKLMLILSLDEMRKSMASLFVAGKEYAPSVGKYLMGKAFLVGLLSEKINPFNWRKKPVVEQIPLNTFNGSVYSFEWKN